jgi:hypothetical protein
MDSKFKNLSIDTSEHEHKHENNEKTDETHLPKLLVNKEWLLQIEKRNEKEDDYYERENIRIIKEKNEIIERENKFIKQLNIIQNIDLIISMSNIYIDNLDLLYLYKYKKLKNILRDKLIEFYHIYKRHDVKLFFNKIFYEENIDDLH